MKTNAFFQLFVAVACMMCGCCFGKGDSSGSTESGSNG